jgi:putative flippase GtrA
MKGLTAQQREIVVQFLKFGTVGFFGFFIDYGFYHVGYDILGFNHYESALFSFPFAGTFAWIGNRTFTFRGNHKGHAGVQWMRFLMVAFVGIIFNRGTFSILTATVPLVYKYPVLGLLAGTGAGMFFNFFFSRRHVFR